MIERVSPVPVLNELYVYVTNGCNCSCRHCWIVPEDSGKVGRPVHFLAPGTFAAAIEEAVPLGLNSVKWTGGEPTIHPAFEKLLKIQNEYGLGGRIETNGMQVTAEMSQLLQECGVTGVSVSLDGALAATHDSVRSVSGGFERTLAGIGHLVEAGYRPEIIMSLMRGNIGELEALLDLAAQIGAGSVKLNVVQPTLRGSALRESGEDLPITEILQLNQRLKNELQPRYELPIFLDVPMAFRELGKLVEGDGLSSCGILGILGLLADGHYALCGVGEHVPELVYGQAGVGHLAEIWSGHPKLIELRKGLPNDLKGVCGDCLMKRLCLGSCVAMNYQQGQGLLAPYWFCEQAHAANLFPASRLKS
jgi:SynChlorMet cassette radical SAM/SPASM protein ScmF